MPLSREEAYELLELPVGTDQDSIRTSYKRLATKWHPEKNNNNPQAQKKFQLISTAYRRLTTNDERLQNLNKEQSLTLFKEVLFTKSMNFHNGSTYDSSDDDDDDDDDDDNDNDEFDDERYASLFPDRFKLKQDMKKAKAGSINSNKHLSVEQINKNAEELITEEEKEKRRAEKRRAKKKRRREKKKQEKVDEKPEDKPQKTKVKDPIEIPEKHNKPKKVEKKESDSSSDGADFDPNSAFFTKVKNKKKNKMSSVDVKDRRGQGGNSDDEPDDLDPVVLRSRQLAIKGNEMAQQGHYTAAIELFTEAVKLDPRDFRFFGNRSYCFDRTQQYERALKDAENAIRLADKWAKGYFRKGRALAGLRMFSEAEEAFSQVLKLDKNCEDAVQELLRVRTSQIKEMGFSKAQSEAAIKQYGTVQSALDNLLAGVAENVLGGEVYVSDDESGFSSPVTQRIHQLKIGKDEKMDFKNPEGLTALWVGNVLPDKVDDKKLFKIFSRYGSVTSVRCLPEKFCAFINYSTKEAAGKAMHHLQAYECGGQKLLIKFPDNPILNGTGNTTIRKSNPHGTIILQKTKQPPTKVVVQPTPTAQEIQKQSGPVNGDECYFWRTTGCSFGDKCRNKHNPSSKGLDMKPWQLKK
ncbi:uncharacterized protein LOC134714567 isoform X1 [Mytilus trossulus]|uniref:uncharacterized protein LOC134714567 isoform X1 n=1 Tax=Mytilus trossulus TaxID=6551 RepID=UPI003006AE89